VSGGGRQPDKKKSIKTKQKSFIRETPIPQAKRSGIGKLNNPA
jgi:hypothetical protein